MNQNGSKPVVNHGGRRDLNVSKRQLDSCGVCAKNNRQTFLLKKPLINYMQI